MRRRNLHRFWRGRSQGFPSPFGLATSSTNRSTAPWKNRGRTYYSEPYDSGKTWARNQTTSTINFRLRRLNAVRQLCEVVRKRSNTIQTAPKQSPQQKAGFVCVPHHVWFNEVSYLSNPGMWWKCSGISSGFVREGQVVNTKMAVSRQGRPPRSSRSVHPNPLVATHLFAESLHILGLKQKIAWYIGSETKNRLIHWVWTTTRVIENVFGWLVVALQVTTPPPRKESLHNDHQVA